MSLRYKNLLLCLSLLLAGLLTTRIEAAQLRVAVASNFTSTAQALKLEFEASSEHQVVIISGSTGKHYAQIKHGAPFDILLAADRQRPKRLVDEGLALADARFTYAIGRLILLGGDRSRLLAGDFEHLAIANPLLAPYGLAAKQTLQKLAVWERLQKKLIRGENIAQAYQYIDSGNAELGLLARAQVLQTKQPYWLIPSDWHQTIAQQSALLKDSLAAREYLAFLRSARAIEIIRQHGYDIPDD